MTTPVQIELATQFAPVIDADATLVQIMDEGSISEEKSRTSWAFVLERLATTFTSEQLASFPVPGSKDAQGNNPADHWERTVSGPDGNKTEKGTFYKSLFLSTVRGKALVAKGNDLDKTITDARERKAEKSRIDSSINYHVKLLRRAMNVQYQLWSIETACPHVVVRWIKTGAPNAKTISTAAKNIELTQYSGPDKEMYGKGDVLGYSSFLSLKPAKALEVRGGIAELVSVQDLLATKTRGADEPGVEEVSETNNYPAPKNMADFENLVATFAMFADKLETKDGTKALWDKVNAAGSDDFIASLAKVWGAINPVMVAPAVKRRLAAINAMVDTEAA